jgi:putative membrane protein
MNKRMSVIALSLAGFTLLFAACGTQPGGGTANNEPLVKTSPAKAPSDTGNQVVTGGDLSFIMDAAPGGMAEVELGRLALKQAASNDMKQFAQRMIDDHSKAGEELQVGIKLIEHFLAASDGRSAQL